MRNNDLKKDANYIKATLIDYLLGDSLYELMVNELPFFQGQRRADLIAIKDCLLIGFEIKSELDTLKSAEVQLQDYNKLCNIVYLVIAENFANSKELRSLPKNVGILIFKNDTIVQKRKPKIIKKPKKDALAAMLWRKELEDLLHVKKLEIHELRNKVIVSKTTNEIHSKVLDVLLKRYKHSYNLFLHDRGDYTTIEDLRTITRIDKMNRYF